MDTNKMREQFEAWDIQENGLTHKPSGLVRLAKKPCGEYRYGDARRDWKIWQASREAVVVELPRITGHEYDPLADADYREGCRAAIEAQGLKVKP